jgi:hypothetical protein
MRELSGQCRKRVFWEMEATSIKSWWRGSKEASVAEVEAEQWET